MFETQLRQERMHRVLRALSRSTRVNHCLESASSKLVTPPARLDTLLATRPRTLIEKNHYDR